MPNYRFSGHESFPCRYSWLPKAFRFLRDDARGFSDEDNAIVELGLGKNMVRSARFWMQATGIATPRDGGGYDITALGEALLGTNGLDQFLEDIRTLWLIHWKLSTHVDSPLFAWDCLLNKWVQPEISRSEVIRHFQQEAERLERSLSQVTLEQHFDIFLHTYVPTKSNKGEVQEDNLDCPLVELDLIRRVGERVTGNAGKHEAIYAFRRDSKPDVTPELFAYCINDFWNARHHQEQSLGFREIAFGHCGPGQVFKLPETDIRERLLSIDKTSHGAYRYHESVARPYIEKTRLVNHNFLSAIYRHEDAICLA